MQHIASPRKEFKIITSAPIRHQEKTQVFTSDPMTLYKLHGRRQKLLIAFRKGNRT